MRVVSHVSLTNDKSLYVGSTIKLVLGMNTTSFQPALQRTVMMPEQPTPSEDLATLLESPKEQRVDLLALVVNVSPERTATTKLGQRTIVDVRVRDLSGIAGASECEFCFFLQTARRWTIRVGNVAGRKFQWDPSCVFNLIVPQGRTAAITTRNADCLSGSSLLLYSCWFNGIHNGCDIYILEP